MGKYRIRYMVTRITGWVRDEAATAAMRSAGNGAAADAELRERLDDGIFRTGGLPFYGRYTTIVEGKPREDEVARRALREYAKRHCAHGCTRPTGCEIRWECEEVEE